MKVNDATNLATQEGEVSPELEKKMETYVASLMHMIHSDETSKDVLEMLKAAPPEESIPEVVLQLNSMVEQSFQGHQGGVEDEVKIAGGLYAVADLAELGNAAGLWDRQLQQEEVIKIFEKTASKYIHKGLKDGTIDPIELQRDTEPLLPPEVREKASLIQKELGLPDQPTESMAIDKVVKDKTSPLQKENEELKGLLRGMQQPQQGGGGQDVEQMG